MVSVKNAGGVLDPGRHRLLGRTASNEITSARPMGAEADYLFNSANSNRVLNLCGETSLTELIHLFNIGNLLISNDSGPAHFAALTDIHVVVFFGPESPALYKPLTSNCTVLYANYACSPCVSAFNQRLSPCNDNICLKSIQVEAVYHTVCKRLSARNDDDRERGMGRSRQRPDAAEVT